MDLKYLIDQLEAELAARSRQQQISEAAELAEGEIAKITLQQRLFAALGKEIALYPPAGQALLGILSQVGNGWALVKTTLGEELVNLKNCAQIVGLGAAHTTALEIQKRSQINQVLRRIARRRARVCATLSSGTSQTGYLVAVYADHLDLIAEENRRRQITIPGDGIFSIKIVN